MVSAMATAPGRRDLAGVLGWALTEAEVATLGEASGRL
jgi:hypothetical protein